MVSRHDRRLGLYAKRRKVRKSECSNRDWHKVTTLLGKLAPPLTEKGLGLSKKGRVSNKKSRNPLLSVRNEDGFLPATSVRKCLTPAITPKRTEEMKTLWETLKVGDVIDVLWDGWYPNMDLEHFRAHELGRWRLATVTHKPKPHILKVAYPLIDCTETIDLMLNFEGVRYPPL